MNTIELHTTSGIVKHGESAEAILATFNRHVNLYEIRTNADGVMQLWHKGDRRVVGEFKPKK